MSENIKLKEFNIWETNSPTYYTNLNAKLHLLVENTAEKIALLDKHSAEFTDESATRIKGSVTRAIQDIIGLSPLTDKLPDPSSKDIKTEEENYKKNIFNDVFIPVIELGKLVKGLNLVNSKSDNIDLDKIVKELEANAKQILKLAISPDLGTRSRANHFEKSREKLAKANGVEYKPNDPEDNHISAFFASGRNNPFDYQRSLFGTLKDLSESFEAVKNLTYDIRKENRGIEHVIPEVSELNDANNHFERSFRDIRRVIKASSLGNFWEDKSHNPEQFSQSDKIRAADFIINHKYEDTYVDASDVVTALHRLEKFFIEGEKYENAHRVHAINEKLKNTVESSRAIWATHSNIARDIAKDISSSRAADKANVAISLEQNHR